MNMRLLGAIMESKLGAPIGFAAGAVVGGLAFQWIGWLAFVQVERGLVGLLVFFVGFLAYMGSFFTPLTFVLFLGKGYEDNLAHAQLFKAAGYLATFLMLVGIGLGIYLLDPLDLATPELMMFLDGVFGVVWGGIVGTKLARRRMRRRPTPA